MKKIIFFLFFHILFVGSSMATHIMSASITYEYINNDSFEIVVTIYRDCNGIAMQGYGIQIKTECKTDTVYPSLVSVRNVTGIPGYCPDKSRCDSGGLFNYGIEEYILKAKVRLGITNCVINGKSVKACLFKLSFSECCRNKSITTGAQNAPAYVESILDRCLAPTNSSPKFLSQPTFLVPLGSNQCITNTAIDSINNDFVTYELINPHSNENTFTWYSGMFSKDRPLTFLGFPDVTKPLPAGFHFDSVTSSMCFKPVINNEITVVAIRMNEWRRINGFFTKIGSVIRDAQIIIINSNNKAPEFSPTQTNIFPLNCGKTGSYCFDIPIIDSNSTDTITVKIKHNIPNFTTSNIGSSPSNYILRACVNIDSLMLRTPRRYQLTVYAEDGKCPVPGKVEKTFILQSAQQLPNSFQIKASLNCRRLYASILNLSQIQLDAISWSIWNTKDSININSIKADNVVLNDTGWYYIKAELFASEYCSREYIDSVYIGEERFLTMNLDGDRENCNYSNDTVTFKNITNGKQPFKILWSTGDTTNYTVLFASTTKQTVSVTIIDDNSCVVRDTIVIGVFNPEVNFNKKNGVCFGDNYVAQAIITNAASPTYEWVGYSTNNLLLVDTPTANKNYRFVLTDSFGCKVDTSIFVTVYKPQISISGKTTLCQYDTLILQSNKTGGLPPTQVTWHPSTTIADNLSILPLHSAGNKTISATIKDGFGCTYKDSVVVTVNASPTITINPVGPYCETNSNVSLVSNANPKGGKWWGTGVINDSTFSPAIALKGTNTIAYTYLDTTTGCYGADSLQIQVWGQPKADFVALKTIGLPNDTIQFINTTSNPSSTTNQWDMGDFGKAGNIQTTINAQHSYADTGVYDVKLWVSNGVCSPDSIIKTAYIKIGNNYLSVLSISKNKLLIYPNPAKDRLTIEADNILGEIVLIDVLGRRYTVESNINATKTGIDIQHLSAGIYVIEARDIEGNTYKSKVQISR